MKNLELLSKITLTLISTDAFDEQMNSILKIAGEHSQVSRAYIFIDTAEEIQANPAYEWCDTGILPGMNRLLESRDLLFPSFTKILSTDEKICTESILELPVSIAAALEPLDIQSILLYPIYKEKKIQGFIGFDDCWRNRLWQDSEHQLLQTLSGFISAACERKDYRENLKNIESEFRLLKESSRLNTVFKDIVGTSDAIEGVFSQLDKVIDKDINILIRGESGTGKELFAKAIHLGSHRKDGPFVTVNCSAISTDIAESLLFGHRKGAFTGAHSDSTGFFEQAHNGTIFLDEIGDMPIEIQSKILRIIEDRKIKPVGDSREKEVDCRIISATNVNLEEAANLKKFRHDLFYRINEFPVTVPPLRERKGDIPVLCKYFINKISQFYEIENISINKAAIKELERYEWPGNIRELKSTIQRLVLTCPGSIIEKNDAASILNHSSSSQSHKNTYKETAAPETLAEIEKNMIIKVYMENNRNVEKTAEILKKGRTTVYRKLKNYEII